MGGDLPAEGEGISLIHFITGVFGEEVVFVQIPVPHAGDKTLPDAGAVPSGPQRVGLGIPSVEIADDRNPIGIGSPDGKIDSLPLAIANRMSAQFVVEAEVTSFAEEVDVVVGEKGLAHSSPVMRYRIASEGKDPKIEGVTIYRNPFLKKQHPQQSGPFSFLAKGLPVAFLNAKPFRA